MISWRLVYNKVQLNKYLPFPVRHLSFTAVYCHKFTLEALCTNRWLPDLVGDQKQHLLRWRKEQGEQTSPALTAPRLQCAVH